VLSALGMLGGAGREGSGFGSWGGSGDGDGEGMFTREDEGDKGTDLIAISEDILE
jgi:hypothetical protein